MTSFFCQNFSPVGTNKIKNEGEKWKSGVVLNEVQFFPIFRFFWGDGGNLDVDFAM